MTAGYKNFVGFVLMEHDLYSEEFEFLDNGPGNQDVRSVWKTSVQTKDLSQVRRKLLQRPLIPVCPWMPIEGSGPKAG